MIADFGTDIDNMAVRSPSTVSGSSYSSVHSHHENTYVSEPTENSFNVSEDQVEMDEIGPIISGLRLGTTMTKFPTKSNRRPEQKTFVLNLEEFKISWFKMGVAGKEEGCGKSFEVCLG